MYIRLQQHPDGTMAQCDPVALAAELQTAFGKNFGLTTAGPDLTLYTEVGDDEAAIAAVVEQHLSADAGERRQAVARRAAIMTRLDQIDAESVRPLRAHIAGSATSADDDKLKTLDEEARGLRQELSTL